MPVGHTRFFFSLTTTNTSRAVQCIHLSIGKKQERPFFSFAKNVSDFLICAIPMHPSPTHFLVCRHLHAYKTTMLVSGLLLLFLNSTLLLQWTQAIRWKRHVGGECTWNTCLCGIAYENLSEQDFCIVLSGKRYLYSTNVSGILKSTQHWPSSSPVEANGSFSSNRVGPMMSAFENPTVGVFRLFVTSPSFGCR